jgi:hypothetical protein
MVKMGIDKLGARLKEDEFLIASLQFFIFATKQIFKRFSITTNDPAFQAKSVLEQNGIIQDIFEGTFLDGKSLAGCFKKYNIEQLSKLIESASGKSESIGSQTRVPRKGNFLRRSQSNPRRR